MQAASVIPAPIAYITVVAVKKKLVVGFRGGLTGPPQGEHWSATLPLESPDCSQVQLSRSSDRLL